MVFLESPLVKALLAVNGLMLIVLLVANYWPLPDAPAQSEKEISAEEIAGYLGETRADPRVAIERPIFHINRRPPKPVPVKPKAAPVVRKPAFLLELVGVMGATSGNPTAFLLHTGNQQTHTVRSGQVVDGWTITEIGLDSVRLVKDSEQKTLDLK